MTTTDLPAFLARHEQDVRDHVRQLLDRDALDEGNAAAMDAYIDQLLHIELGRMSAAHQRDLDDLQMKKAALEVEFRQAEARATEAAQRHADLSDKLARAQATLVGARREEQSR